MNNLAYSKHIGSDLSTKYWNLVSLLRRYDLDPSSISDLENKLATLAPYFAKFKNAEQLFDVYCEQQTNKRATTLQKYRIVFDEFLRFSDIFNKETVLAFIKSEQKRGIAPTTINLKISALKSVAKWSYNEDYFPKDMLANVHPLIVDERPKDNEKILDDINLQEIFDRCFESAKNGFVGSRNAFLTMLLACCGSRIGETTNLDVKDLTLFENDGTPQYRFLFRNTKGKKDRYVYFPSEYSFIVDEYLNERAKIVDASEQALFISALKTSKVSRRLTVRGANDIVNRVAGVNPHAFRHFNASYLLSKGANIYDVATALGHASPTTTMIYSHDTENAVKRTAETLNGVI